ncbi:hypothetical protein GOBAR_AA17219 [Gossypium barbadense]|uniref:Apple domain-containing protein n=1 Tax=Gossypium barbadense TaxID=3634 RepID=A0A2P5XJD8_GOSBA|nr:hypothetical protein GOBAR_AA17219 [Gossypium barbadense]
MASNFSFKALPVLALALLAAFCQATLDTCTYPVSSAGKRCVLEKHVKRSGKDEFTCQTSEIEDDKISNWIEIDQCVKACGLGRKCFGILSDSLLKSRFTQMFAPLSATIADPTSPTFTSISPREKVTSFNSVFLPKLCEAPGANTQRGLAEIRSSCIVAPGPASGVKFLGVAPTMPPL